MSSGDIHWVDLPVANGREQRGRRPAVVVQDDHYAGNLPVVLVEAVREVQVGCRYVSPQLIDPLIADYAQRLAEGAEPPHLTAREREVLQLIAEGKTSARIADQLPPITAYLFHLYPLSILAQDNAYLPWLYSTHIQLFNFPSEELKFYTHPFCTRHEVRHLYFPTCPLLASPGLIRYYPPTGKPRQLDLCVLHEPVFG